MPRALGVDLGERRIGLAVCDSGGLLATPYGLLARTADTAADHRALGEAADEVGAEVVVIGLPLSLDGSVGPAARRVLSEVETLVAVLKMPVETQDERLTTVTADRALRRVGHKAQARRRVVDSVAAAVILQDWLDRRLK